MSIGITNLNYFAHVRYIVARNGNISKEELNIFDMCNKEKVARDIKIKLNIHPLNLLIFCTNITYTFDTLYS